MKCMRILFAAIAALLLTTQTAVAQDDQIEKIKDRGVLRACMAEALPWGYKDPETGEWTGYNTDAGPHLADSLGVELEYVDATWGTIIPNLLTDKCDIALVPLFMTLERAQTILFTDPWGVVTKSAAVREGSDLRTYEDLNDPDVTISVLSGTGDENHAHKWYPKAQINAIADDSVSTIFVEVASRRADAAVTDTSTLREVLKDNPRGLEELPADPVAPQPYAYGVAPGEYHWHRYLNIWLDRIKEEGLKKEWWNKWMGMDPQL